MGLNEDFEFVAKHRQRGALFDANLLLVYIVGKAGRHLLQHSGRTKQYADEFPYIERLFESFAKVYTTPNVLTEVSNLGKKLGSPFFTALAKAIYVMDERYCESKTAATSKGFNSFGLTDSALLNIGREVLIVTADSPLHYFLRSNNIDSANYANLKKGFGRQGLAFTRQL